MRIRNVVVLGRQALRTVDTVASGLGRERWILNRSTFKIQPTEYDPIGWRVALPQLWGDLNQFAFGTQAAGRHWFDHYAEVRGLPRRVT